MLKLVLLVCVGVALAAPTFDNFQAEATFEFGKFVTKFGKDYSSQEELESRLAIFAKNLAIIKEHNAKGESWTLGVTKFADLTPEEFKAQFHGYKRMSPRDDSAFRASMVEDVPASVDWRTKNVVTPVKNQLQCGSCWAFSTTGSVEAAWAQAKGQLLSLSEQQLVDCSGAFGNYGCSGGLMDYAFKYIIQNGITTEDAYPYNAVDQTCKNFTAVVKISSYTDVTANNPTALKAAVSQQPVSVAVEADQTVWQLYNGGVVTSNCGSNLDHGVLVVGYGNDGSNDYWIVKNSWGSAWGESGYIRIKNTGASDSGLCGINMDASYPVV